MDFCGFCKLRLGWKCFFYDRNGRGDCSFYRIACGACCRKHGGYQVHGVAASGTMR